MRCDAMMPSLPSARRGTRRILIEHRPAGSSQLRLFSLETTHDATDIRNFVPAQPENIARAGHLLILGPAVFCALLRIGARGPDCDQDHDRSTPHAQSSGIARRQLSRPHFRTIPHVAPSSNWPDLSFVSRFATFVGAPPMNLRLNAVQAVTPGSDPTLTTGLCVRGAHKIVGILL